MVIVRSREQYIKVDDDMKTAEGNTEAVGDRGGARAVDQDQGVGARGEWAEARRR